MISEKKHFWKDRVELYIHIRQNSDTTGKDNKILVHLQVIFGTILSYARSTRKWRGHVEYARAKNKASRRDYKQLCDVSLDRLYATLEQNIFIN